MVRLSLPNSGKARALGFSAMKFGGDDLFLSLIERSRGDLGEGFAVIGKLNFARGQKLAVVEKLPLKVSFINLLPGDAIG